MTISRQRLHKIEAIGDKDIDSSNIPATDAAFWADVELRMPQTKKGVYLLTLSQRERGQETAATPAQDWCKSGTDTLISL